MIGPFFILFSIMGLGYLARWRRWLNEDALKGIANLLINFAMPALLLYSMIEQDMKGKDLVDFFVMTGFSIGFFMLYAMLALILLYLVKYERKYKGMAQLTMFSSNNGFMGYPLTLAFFGQAAMLTMVANNLAMNIVQWTYGLHALRRENPEFKKKVSVLEALKNIFNINIIAILIGLALSLTGTSDMVPEFIRSLLSYLAALATPLSMIYIGATLYGAGVKDLFFDKKVFFPAVSRLMIFSVITFFILLFMPISLMMKKVLLLVAVLPSASMAPVMTLRFGTGTEISSKITVLSTVCSMITIPLGVLAVSFF